MAITKVTIDDNCTVCGLCETTAPDVFEMGDSKAQVKAGADLNANEDAVREAADSCPTSSIKVS
ncbi:MAG: ferredoxin [Candidatus Saganbacteria bacterium]|nr:ferredoxin [Candidatus Saganbacteria bacterium]